MNTNEIVRFLLIIIAAVVFIYLIHTYNNTNDEQSNNKNSPSDIESFYADGEATKDAPNSEELRKDLYDEYRNDNVANAGRNFEGIGSGSDGVDSENESDNGSDVNNSDTDPLPSEGEDNETFKTVNQQPQEDNNESGNNKNANRLPNECYPKDVLTPGDLLPQDSNSTWAQTVPSGQGSLGDQNFLNAGFHVGINTVGQSLRNANLQLRSEPSNPQMKVSPWLQTTIEPDANRRPLEIGA